MNTRAPSSPAGARQRHRTYFSTGAGLLLLAWLLVPASPAIPVVGDCELTFEPTSVEVGSEETTVRAIPSEEVHDFDHATVDPDSGLQVSLIPDEPFHLVVDATNGVPGDWEISLNHGELPVCAGHLTVQEAEA